MTDKILELFFDKHRWEEALNKGAIKGIREAVLRDYMSPNGRKQLLAEIMTGSYHIERPHTAKIPKDTPGEFRTVFINSDRDRIFLSLVNDLLFDICKDMVHPQCKSYQKGIGCAKVVTKASKMIDEQSGTTHSIIGWKSDLSKYFDSVPIQYIDEAFDKVENLYGHSVIIDVVREYYHNNRYYDTEAKEECEKYQSLKQGCAVASWLADVILYHIDERLDSLVGYYVRYSDDTLFIGKRSYKEAMKIMQEELGKMNMTLNPKKVEYLTNDKWFKFLGYSIKGSSLSLSGTRLKTFQKEIYSRTIKQIRHHTKYETILRSVLIYLYYGNEEHSWATSVLKTINVKEDISTLNSFVMDCLRAAVVGKSCNANDIGGLGYVKTQEVGCVSRGKGKKIRTLRDKFPELNGYYTLNCMRNSLLYSKDVYNAIVREML